MSKIDKSKKETFENENDDESPEPKQTIAAIKKIASDEHEVKLRQDRIPATSRDYFSQMCAMLFLEHVPYALLRQRLSSDDDIKTFGYLCESDSDLIRGCGGEDDRFDLGRCWRFVRVDDLGEIRKDYMGCLGKMKVNHGRGEKKNVKILPAVKLSVNGNREIDVEDDNAPYILSLSMYCPRDTDLIVERFHACKSAVDSKFHDIAAKFAQDWQQEAWERQENAWQGRMKFRNQLFELLKSSMVNPAADDLRYIEDIQYGSETKIKHLVELWKQEKRFCCFFHLKDEQRQALREADDFLWHHVFSKLFDGISFCDRKFRMPGLSDYIADGISRDYTSRWGLPKTALHFEEDLLADDEEEIWDKSKNGNTKEAFKIIASDPELTSKYQEIRKWMFDHDFEGNNQSHLCLMGGREQLFTRTGKWYFSDDELPKLYKNLSWLWAYENVFLMVERQTNRFPYVEDIDVLGDRGKMPPQICEFWSFMQRRALPILELATELQELRCLVFEANGFAQKKKEEKCRMKASYHLFFPDVIVDGSRAKKIRNHTVERFKQYTSKHTDPMFWLERMMTFGHMNGFENNRWEAVFDKTCCNEG